MPGPSPTYRPCFPLAFLAQARQMIRQRTIKFQLRQRAVLVILLHEQPLLSNVEAGRWAQLHPDSVRHWRRRWARGDFSLEDEPGRGRKGFPEEYAKFLAVALPWIISGIGASHLLMPLTT